MGGIVMMKEDVVETLNGLIEICRDGQVGYLQAATGPEPQILRSVFQKYACQREEFINDLANLVISLSAEPANTRCATGKPVHAWIKIGAAISSDDVITLLCECEQSEEIALSIYERALDKHLPEYMRTVIYAQYEQLLKAHEHIEDLHRSHKS